jgi:hypothetical protein
MRLIVRLALAILPLVVLIGCDNGKPKPAELPKQLMEPPKTRPIPGGGGGKTPPQTSQSGPWLEDRHLG